MLKMVWRVCWMRLRAWCVHGRAWGGSIYVIFRSGTPTNLNHDPTQVGGSSRGLTCDSDAFISLGGCPGSQARDFASQLCLQRNDQQEGGHSADGWHDADLEGYKSQHHCCF